MTAYGLDFSLTSTGLASFDGDTWDTATIRTTPVDSSPGSFLSRVDHICGQVINWLDPQDGDTVCIEGIAFSAKGQRVDRLHYGWWAVLKTITEHHGEPFIVTATALKRLALGKGVGGKDEMILATTRLIPDSPIRNNDEADASWLAVAASIIDGHPAIALPVERLNHLRKAVI